MRKKQHISNEDSDSCVFPSDHELESSSTRSNSRNSSKSRLKFAKTRKTIHYSTNLHNDDTNSLHSDELLDSDAEEGDLNRAGNVPFNWYQNEDHVGYTVESKKLIKDLDSTKLGQLIFNSEDPDAWRTIVDPRNNRTIKLTDHDLKVIRRIRKGMYPSETYDAESLGVEIDNEDSKFPISFELPPKSRFLPSKFEAMKVARLVKLIKDGKIFTSEQRKEFEKKQLEELERVEDIWKDAIYDVDPTSARRRMKHQIKPPKSELPTHAESYNPPDEYLLDEEETKNWLETEAHERERNYMPTKYSSLRVVPVYAKLIVERYTRCLQLLTCPRAVKLRMNVDPESLLPQLPKPEELGPYPKAVSVEYMFKGLKRMSIDHTGRFLALCSNGAVRVCDVMTGFCTIAIEFNDINCVMWHTKLPVLVVAHEMYVSMLALDLPNMPNEHDGDDYEKAKQYLHMESEKGTWKPVKKGAFEGLTIKHAHAVANMAVHPGGNYIVCVSPDSKEAINQCMLHCVPKKSSMRLGNKISNNRIKLALFHPTEPKLIVAFTRNIRVYNLSTMASTKGENKLTDESKLTGVELPVSVDTNGTYLISGDEQGRLVLFDQEISTFPYKAYSFENEAIVKVEIHRRLPLVLVAYKKCVKCFHLSQTTDGEAMFVPLNELKPEGSLEDCVWHPNEPWLFTCTEENALMWA